MRNIKKRWFLFAAADVLVAAAGIHMGVKAEEDENRVIAERVYIGDVSVAGMTEEEATAAVEDYIESLQDTAIQCSFVSSKTIVRITEEGKI